MYYLASNKNDSEETKEGGVKRNCEEQEAVINNNTEEQHQQPETKKQKIIKKDNDDAMDVEGKLFEKLTDVFKKHFTHLGNEMQLERTEREKERAEMIKAFEAERRDYKEFITSIDFKIKGVLQSNSDYKEDVKTIKLIMERFKGMDNNVNDVLESLKDNRVMNMTNKEVIEQIKIEIQTASKIQEQSSKNADDSMYELKTVIIDSITKFITGMLSNDKEKSSE